MDDLFEFLGFQDAMKQSENQQSMSDMANDLIANSNYKNTVLGKRYVGFANKKY